MTRVVEIEGLDELKAQLDLIASRMTSGVAVALLAGGDVIVDSIKSKILERGLIDSGDLYNSVKAEAATESEVVVSEGPLAYVFAHEFGLRNQIITERQRKFFWAKYKDTDNSMWKALAMSTTYTIPARPHFRPGVADSKQSAVSAIAEKANEILGG